MKAEVRLTNVYKFRIWDPDDSFESGRDHFVVADSEYSAIEKMKMFSKWMAFQGSPIKFNLNPRLYLEGVSIII